MSNLKPRAIAVLVTLRTGSKTDEQINDAIGDEALGHTMCLLLDMKRDGLVVRLNLSDLCISGTSAPRLGPRRGSRMPDRRWIWRENAATAR